jgi:hypothetical protein
MKKTYVPLLAAFALFAACENNPVEAPEVSTLTASITTDAFQLAYTGSAEFHIGNPPGGGEMFQIVSAGRGGLAAQGFAITRYGGGMLPVGEHQVQLVDLASWNGNGPAPQGILLQYGRTIGTANPLNFTSEMQVGVVEELYVADSGTLTITVSTPERVEGTFNVSGFRYCPAPASAGTGTVTCSLPAQPIPGAPRMTVSGGFVSTPLDTTVWPL